MYFIDHRLSMFPSGEHSWSGLCRCVLSRSAPIITGTRSCRLSAGARCLPPLRGHHRTGATGCHWLPHASEERHRGGRQAVTSALTPAVPPRPSGERKRGDLHVVGTPNIRSCVTGTVNMCRNYTGGRTRRVQRPPVHSLFCHFVR